MSAASPGGSSSAVRDVAGRHDVREALYLPRASTPTASASGCCASHGHPAANCNLLPPTCHPEAKAGYVIMEQVEYPPMSGTNTICVATVLLETGMLPMVEPVTELTLESPAGLIRVRAECRDGKVMSVTFRNVPAFAVHLDAPIEVPTLGTVRVDVAYGGMWYVMARPRRSGCGFALRGPRHGADLRGDQGRPPSSFRSSTRSTPRFAGVSIGQLWGPALDPAYRPRTPSPSPRAIDWDRPATWTGAIDRSPCGTGTCARDGGAVRAWEAGRRTRVSSRGHPGTVFTGRPLEETTVGQHRAVVPTITGRPGSPASASYVLEPTHPFPEGYTVSDIW